MKRVILTAAMLALGLASAAGPKAIAKLPTRRRSVRLSSRTSPRSTREMRRLWRRCGRAEAVYTNPLSGEQVVGRDGH